MSAERGSSLRGLSKTVSTNVRSTRISLQLAHSSKDYLDVLKDIVVEAYSRLVETAQDQQACRKRSGMEVENIFFMSWTALEIYGCVILALIARRAWILYLAFPFLLKQIFWVAFKWILYIIDDPKLFENIAVTRGWAQKILREGEKILLQKNATKTIMASTMLYSTPTGISYARAILRYRMHEMNTRVASTMTKDRHSERLETIATRIGNVSHSLRQRRGALRKQDLRNSSDLNGRNLGQ